MEFIGNLTHFQDADQMAEHFEDVLKNIGVSIRPSGVLETFCLQLKELADFHTKDQIPRPCLDLHQHFRHAVGFRQLLHLTLKCAERPGFANFAPHFELLNHGTPLQNTIAPANDPSGNKTLELLVGLACLSFAEAVELDDPNNAEGNNPDVLVAFNGEIWGLACKVPNGTSAITLYERFEEGVNQIQNSRATTGIVVLNFKNTFDHLEAFPKLGFDEEGEILLGTYNGYQQVVDKMIMFNEEKIFAMRDHATQPALERLFNGVRALPGVLVISQTTIGLKLEGESVPEAVTGKPMSSLIGFAHLIPLEHSDLWNNQAENFFQHLNDAFH